MTTSRCVTRIPLSLGETEERWLGSWEGMGCKGRVPVHTYSSSSYSLGGQTATTRSIQSCREKPCDRIGHTEKHVMDLPGVLFRSWAL